MTDDSDISEKTLALILGARSFDSAGDINRAVALMNDAKTLNENAGIPTFSLKVQREMLVAGHDARSKRKPIDVSGVNPILKDALSFYHANGDILEQIDTLINLSATTQDRLEALKYLDEAEHLMTSITDSQIVEISKSSSIFSNFPVQELLAARLKDVRQRKLSILSE